jgi:toxin-antitoxin system PIN domain toxin
VILVDANLLLYAKVRDFPQHEAARTWLDRRLSENAPVGFPWASLLAFVRLVTNPRVFHQPLTIPAAWQQVEAWLNRPAAWIPAPTERHRDILGQLVQASVDTSDLVSDAHIAALAIEHGLTLCSADRDFARFPDLRWENPLAPPGRATRK